MTRPMKGQNMADFENPVTFLRSLKGAPLSVLVALALARKALTNAELCTWTGYRDDNIREAVRLLGDLGWVTARSPRGPWSLAEGRQLPLMSWNPDFFGVVSSSSTYLDPGPTIEQEEEEEENPDFFGVAANLRALDEVGIREPARSELAKLPHVTPDFIRGHVARALEEGGTLGTAIHRIRYNWALPEGRGVRVTVRDRGRRGVERLSVPDDLVRDVARFMGHAEGCTCLDCVVARSRGSGALCPDCRRFYCVCDDEREDV